MLFDLVEYFGSADVDVVHRERNFFGTLTIRDRNADNPAARQLVLQHGVTTHGTQFVDPARRTLPTTYYSTQSGVGRLLNYFRESPDLGGLRVGAVGLGTGTLAAYIGDGDAITFYDINPAVIEIAASGRWFKYLSDCAFRGGKTRSHSAMPASRSGASSPTPVAGDTTFSCSMPSRATRCPPICSPRKRSPFISLT